MAHDIHMLSGLLASRPPPILPFGFDTATVVARYPTRVKLRFDATGFERMTAHAPRDRPHAFAPGDRVVGSWHLLGRSRPVPAIPTLIAPDAVEHADRWAREDRHVTLYPQHAGTHGKAREQAYVDILRAHGIRAEHATVYEDEELHIDAWAFLPCGAGLRWEWIPIDITLLQYPALMRKQRVARENGVLLVPIDRKHFEGSGTFLVMRTLRLLIEEIGRATPAGFMTRHAARLREAACPRDRQRMHGRP